MRKREVMLGLVCIVLTIVIMSLVDETPERIENFAQTYERFVPDNEVAEDIPRDPQPIPTNRLRITGIEAGQVDVNSGTVEIVYPSNLYVTIQGYGDDDKCFAFLVFCRETFSAKPITISKIKK